MDMFENKMQRLYAATGAKNDTELAEILGIKPPSIAGARKRELVPGGWIEKIALDYNINADWLFFGRGSMRHSDAPALLEASPAVAHSQQLECDVDLRMIPMVEACLSAGGGSLETSGDSNRSYAFRMDFLTRKGNPDAMVLMHVSGDSMEPEIRHGDVVLLDQSQQRVRPGYIYAVGFEDAIYCKRVDMLPGQVVLKSANPAYPPVTIDVRGDLADAFRIIGKVLWSGREYI